MRMSQAIYNHPEYFALSGRCQICHQYKEHGVANIFQVQIDAIGNRRTLKDDLEKELRNPINQHGDEPLYLCLACRCDIAFMQKAGMKLYTAEQLMYSNDDGFVVDFGYRPGLNGCPGYFEPNESCIIKVLDPDDDTQTDEEFTDGSDRRSSVNTNNTNSTFKETSEEVLKGSTNEDEPNPITAAIPPNKPSSPVISLPKMGNPEKAITEMPSAKKKKFLCRYCDIAFTTAESCLQHEEQHGVHDPYVCYICSYRYETLEYMIDHIRECHEAERPYFCVLCGKGFTQRSGLKKHVVVHLESERYACPYCGRNFSRNSNLIKHIQAHESAKRLSDVDEDYMSQESEATKEKTPQKRSKRSNSRTYECEICSQNFPRHKDLCSHMPIHLDCLFTCKICKERFTRREKLILHEKDVHRISYKVEIPCSSCSRKFDNHNDLQQHESTVHCRKSPEIQRNERKTNYRKYGGDHYFQKKRFRRTPTRADSEYNSEASYSKGTYKSPSANDAGFYSETPSSNSTNRRCNGYY